MANPHAVTKQFEQALCEYTGARFAVTTTSCTQALLMAVAWHMEQMRKHSAAQLAEFGPPVITIPSRTYVGVPASIKNAGAWVKFADIDWQGEYQLHPLPIWDAARRFTSGMYRPGTMQCLSFHWSKILGLSQGGAILHDNPEADEWLRRARFDGRREGVPVGEDEIQFPSWHAYISPEVSAHGLMKLSLMAKHNPDLPLSDYPDLSTLEAFK